MKPGDLVKLVLPASARTVDGGVRVVWDLDGSFTAAGTTRFPEGTAAVFLGLDDPELAGVLRPELAGALRALLDCRILIEGRVGWVWSMYLEVV